MTPLCSARGWHCTFLQAGVYTIQVEATGKHTGSFTLRYTLLPQNTANGLYIQGTEDNVVTYGDPLDGTLTVLDAAGGQPLADGQYTLTYAYTPLPAAKSRYRQARLTRQTFWTTPGCMW